MPITLKLSAQFLETSSRISLFVNTNNLPLPCNFLLLMFVVILFNLLKLFKLLTLSVVAVDDGFVDVVDVGVDVVLDDVDLLINPSIVADTSFAVADVEVVAIL